MGTNSIVRPVLNDDEGPLLVLGCNPLFLVRSATWVGLLSASCLASRHGCKTHLLDAGIAGRHDSSTSPLMTFCSMIFFTLSFPRRCMTYTSTVNLHLTRHGGHPMNDTLICSASQLSRVSDLTLDTCTPRLRWMPEHSMHNRAP